MAVTAFVLLAVLASVPAPALKITEIFYKGSELIRSEERFLEIYNDGALTVDLAAVTVRVPASGTSTTNLTLQTGDFRLSQGGVVTNSLELPAGGVAVVMTEDFRKYARLIAFSSNTVLVKPRNKAFSGWSWDNRLHQIALMTNGIEVFSCGAFDLEAASALQPGESLSLNGSRYARSSLNPGTAAKSRLRCENLITTNPFPVRVIYEDPFSDAETVPAAVWKNGFIPDEILLSRSGPGVWSALYQPAGLTHGADMFFFSGPNASVARYQEREPLSPDFRKVLINEIVSDPRRDYSGGGWTGMDGGGLVNETDEWLEIVNAGDGEIALSNWYLYYRSTAGESVKRMSFRANSGGPENLSILKPSCYAVATPENGVANIARLVLFDGHPWIDGRIVDDVEYGTADLTGDGPWNNAPSGESGPGGEESVARVPNAVWDAERRSVFRKIAPSFCGRNPSPDMIWVRNCVDRLTHPVHLVSDSRTETVLPVIVENTHDRETFLLTNAGIHYRGWMILTNTDGIPGDGFLTVRNGVKISVRTADASGAVSAAFTWALEGWSLPREMPDLLSALVYPNPVAAGKDVRLVVANMPAGTEVFLTDPFGNILSRSTVSESGFVEIRRDFKPGIHTVAIRHGSGKVFRKVLVR